MGCTHDITTPIKVCVTLHITPVDNRHRAIIYYSFISYNLRPSPLLDETTQAP